MKTQQNKDIKSVSIRLPLDLLADLHEVAQQNSRSLNGEVLAVLRTHVIQHKKKRGNT